MLIYTEVPLAEITRGDQIAIEMGGVHIAAAVVGTNLEHGTLGFVPLAYAEPTKDGTGFTLAHCHPPTADSKVLTVAPGKDGVKIFKTVDSEAAVTEPLTWERIAELEPQFLVLLREIKAERPREYDYLSIWRKYKERLSDLVGKCPGLRRFWWALWSATGISGLLPRSALPVCCCSISKRPLRSLRSASLPKKFSHLPSFSF